MQREIYKKENIAGLEVIPVSNKGIVLAFNPETYDDVIDDKPVFKRFINSQIEAHPELFPDSIHDGWSRFGFTKESVKQELRTRQILTKADQEVWQIRPSFVMPYMTCDTPTAEKILFLSKWAPSWALAHVFHKDVMTIHRLTLRMGRYNMVGTTVKDSEHLPTDLGADEKHSRISGEKVFIATTVAKQCVFGASVSQGAGEDELTEAYGQFQREAQQVQPNYQPNTVNTDGWKATMNAWRTLFPNICLLQGFLHAILSIRNVATKATNALYTLILEKAWQVYQGETTQQCSQRLRRVREWGEQLKDSPLKSKLLKLCAKKADFLPAYDFPHCLRTSNMIDRLMKGMDKYLFAKQYFHGTLVSAEYGIRAYCLLSNFRPSMYNPTTVKTGDGQRSPFEQLNGFTYHDCWLQNMLIATSGQEMYRFQHKKLG